jgi:hypothetical protein
MKKIVDYLAQQEPVVDFIAEEEALTPQKAKRVKMTPMQKLEWGLYRKECRVSNIEPVLADFLMGEIPSCVTYGMELQLNEREFEVRGRAMAAAAGR